MEFLFSRFYNIEIVFIQINEFCWWILPSFMVLDESNYGEVKEKDRWWYTTNKNKLFLNDAENNVVSGFCKTKSSNLFLMIRKTSFIMTT